MNRAPSSALALLRRAGALVEALERDLAVPETSNPIGMRMRDAVPDMPSTVTLFDSLGVPRIATTSCSVMPS